jgi:hypothetical protein
MRLSLLALSVVAVIFAHVAVAQAARGGYRRTLPYPDPFVHPSANLEKAKGLKTISHHPRKLWPH